MKIKKKLAICGICGIIDQQFIENEKGLEVNEYKNRKNRKQKRIKTRI